MGDRLDNATSQSAQLSLAIPSWVGAMSTNQPKLGRSDVARVMRRSRSGKESTA